MSWYDKIDGAILIAGGAVMGTLARTIWRPEASVGRWLVKAAGGLIVGLLAGGAISQYFKLDGFLAAGAGATCALLAEDIVAGVLRRGKGIADGKVDLSLKGDGDDD